MPQLMSVNRYLLQVKRLQVPENMKFMLNGAPTIGTMDGANVEIVEEVGHENAFIFGLSSDEVIAYEKNHEYDPMTIFNSDSEIRTVLMQLVNGFYSPTTLRSLERFMTHS